MTIGSFGSEVVFGVSYDVIKTFDGMQRKSAVKITKHQLINRPDKLEFNGRELDTVTFSMMFSATWGLNPLKESEALRTLMFDGSVRNLKIGKKIIGKFVISEINEDFRDIDQHGNIHRISVSVTLTEYV